ncbi:reverse transcriptase zinc-binding domain-containing protein [Artemisia annua]|uniref:Reverse transcriptase zinc-binding domain-containing protein n=1 Tax=Artemisia annua TaxID=35608 RepID=A0A2U1P075_ARTAN|nr:reverse transcriptase zinc-binding domain-containing protein [Artemisia annua]
MKSVEQARLSHNMKVKDMISNGPWDWPNNWLNEFPIISYIPVPILCTSSSDKYMWCSNNGKCVNYSTNRAWKDLRQYGDQVEWYDLVWFSNCTLKHSFIICIAVQGRLYTQDRLQKWYPDKEMACPLCESCLDSLNHLFLSVHTLNKRLFRSEKVDSKELTVNVINHVRLKLSSLILKKFVQVLEVSKKWDVVMNEKKR